MDYKSWRVGINSLVYDTTVINLYKTATVCQLYYEHQGMIKEAIYPPHSCRISTPK